jgi:hypothetical protein
VIANSICADIRSCKKIQDVSIPVTGTSSDSGATVDAGYFLIRLFQVIYPRIVVMYAWKMIEKAAGQPKFAAAS